MKYCYKCKQNKELIHFGSNKSKKDAHMDECRKCRLLYNKSESAIKSKKKYNQKNYAKILNTLNLYRQTDIGRLKNQLNAKKQRERNPNLSNEYDKKRKKQDPIYHISKNLRSRLSMAVKKGKAGSAIKDVGCTIQQLKNYLESKFQLGMTWENYGDWHIDHIHPLSKFDLTNHEQFLKACHYTNLQPLWAKENFHKSNKITY